MSSLSRLALLASLVVTGCGGGGGDAVDPDAAPQDDSGGGGDPTLVDQVGCHMLQDSGAPFAVPPETGTSTPAACIVVLGPFDCFARNTGCLAGSETVRFEWEPGSFYAVKAFDWSVVTSSHGEVTTQTNADSGIIDLPASTTITAAITHDASGVTYDIVFRMEDEFVVFEKIDPPGGW